MSINNFYQDNDNVYVYGLTGNKAKDRNENVTPSGYYVAKFNKEEELSWINSDKINDKKGFNDKNHMIHVKTQVFECKSNLYFVTTSDNINENIHYFEIDKKSGNVLNKNKIEFKVNKKYTVSGKIKNFIHSFYELDGFKKNLFDNNTLVAIDINSKLKNYIKSFGQKSKIFFNTYFSKAGIWLVESDNDSYYKVTLF